MALRKCLLILTASAFAAPVFAAVPSLAVNSPTSAQNLAQGASKPIVVTFTNSIAPTAISAGFQFRLGYNIKALCSEKPRRKAISVTHLAGSSR